MEPWTIESLMEHLTKGHGSTIHSDALGYNDALSSLITQHSLHHFQTTDHTH